MTNKYNATAIEVLSGLDPVRKRPGMYTDTSHPNHLIQEVVDNSVDEAIAGFADKITVVLHKDGLITVADNGRGMPVDMHPEEGLSGVEVILTKLHAGGKFSGNSYKFSGGLHGVGVSVVNALSSELKVWVKRDGKEYYIEFADGASISSLEVIGKVGRRNTGTTVSFRPSAKFFDSIAVSVNELTHALRAKAVLLPGLKVGLEIEKTNEVHEWCYNHGLSEYLESSLSTFGNIEYIPKELFIGGKSEEDLTIDWAICWLTDGSSSVTESYVNLVPTVRGGTHVNGLRSGLTEAVREFCDFRNLLPRGIKLAPEDVWESVAYVLSVKMSEPQFAGQAKERLSSREIASRITQTSKDAFSLWLNQHHEVGEMIARLAISNSERRGRKSKKVARKKISTGPALPGKLADCSSNDLDLAELFLVEGDSAGGSAKQARNRENQAIMPLRGKILNTWEASSAEITSSQEVYDISVALGVSPGDGNIENLRYGKICILADADSDGAHIATLLCALFLRHFRELVIRGHVYVAMPPLYRIDAGKKVYYALDNTEKEQIVERINIDNKKLKIQVQRFKGLGEMNPEQLRETTMNPDTRRLVQLTAEFGDGTDEIMDMLLAKKRSADRKNWLEIKGDLASV